MPPQWLILGAAFVAANVAIQSVGHWPSNPPLLKSTTNMQIAFTLVSTQIRSWKQQSLEGGGPSSEFSMCFHLMKKIMNAASYAFVCLFSSRARLVPEIITYVYMSMHWLDGAPAIEPVDSTTKWGHPQTGTWCTEDHLLSGSHRPASMFDKTQSRLWNVVNVEVEGFTSWRMN